MYSWITEDGEFSYNNNWLRIDNPVNTIEQKLKDFFKFNIGICPDEINLVNSNFA